MNTVASFFRELVGLIVDDGSLALAIIATVVVAAIFSVLPPNHPLVTGAILLFGCLGILVANVAKAARS